MGHTCGFFEGLHGDLSPEQLPVVGGVTKTAQCIHSLWHPLNSHRPTVGYLSCPVVGMPLLLSVLSSLSCLFLVSMRNEKKPGEEAEKGTRQEFRGTLTLGGSKTESRGP